MKKSKKFIRAMTVLAALSLFNPIAINPVIASAPANEKSLVTINSIPCKSTDFSLRLFTESAKQSSKNVVVSPFSAYAALSMALNGAAGSTREHMAKTLGATADSVESLNQRNQAVLNTLKSPNDKVQLEIANAVYADKKTPFKHSFIELCQNLYNAEVHNADFSNPATVTDINNWCKDKTHGKIPNIIDKLTAQEKMVLLNSVYFKGTWQSPFKKSATQDDQFTMLSGEKTPVKMMHQTESIPYLKGKDFQAVSIPYVGYHQTMYVFLPDQGSDFPAFIAQFTADNWKEWLPKFANNKTILSLPKFKVEFFKELTGVLTALGMGDAFGPSADFSNMVAPPLPSYISRVLQKTYIDVNEEGTEAAAVTAVVMGMRAIFHEAPPVNFRVDRPFVIALVDNDTNEILFIGSIVKPVS